LARLSRANFSLFGPAYLDFRFGLSGR